METVSDVKKRLKSIVSTLQKSVECPVCLETVKPLFKSCVRGHSVCLECAEKLEKCPLCQELFTLENLVCLKSVLEALPHLCCYSDSGCEEVVEPGNDHEMFCGYRPIICRYLKCSTKIPLVKFLDHHKTHHPVWYICKNEVATNNWWNPTGSNPLYTPVFIFNNWFWTFLMIDDTKKQFKIFFQATPIGKLEHDYYVRVEFRSKEFVYTYTLKAQVLSSCDVKVDNSQGVYDKKVLDKEYCMKIPENELSKFKNEHGQIVFNYNFFRV